MFSHLDITTYASRFSTAVALAAASVLVFTFTVAGASAQSTRVKTEGDFSYTVDLGKSINLTYSFETGTPVDEVQVVMHPIGLHAVSTYGYAELEGEIRVTATYQLQTASPRYFPPGTLFDIRFILRGDNELVLETEEFRVEYLDEERNWQRIGDADLELIYYDIPTSAIRSLHNNVSRNVTRIKEVLGVSEHPPLRAIIFPNVQELTKFGPTISQSATDGIFFGGFAYSRYLLTIMASPSATVLIHELTHLLHDVAMGSPSTVRAPAWLTEGIATYLETGQRNPLPRGYRNNRSVTRFRELSTVPGRQQDIGIFYLQSGDFLGFLAELQGDQSIGELLAELSNGTRVDDALVAVYGGNLDELENVWRAQYGLPPIDVREPIYFEPRRDFPPTLVPIPTANRGAENRLGDSPSNQPEVIDERAEPAPLPTARPVPDRIDAQAPTPNVDDSADGYVTSPFEDGFRTNPTMVLVFFLLALGFGALFIRRMRS